MHLRTGNGRFFSSLLPWSSFNSLLASERLLDDRTRMVRRGRDLPREMWSYVGADLKRVVRPDQLQRFCQEGLSIVLNQVHRAAPALAALVAMLEQNLAARIQTNLYASFGRESAFRAHCDDHDVLVLHLHGRKRWSCHGHRPDACTQNGVVPEERLAPALWEDVLEPGDILYIPRGEVHRAALEGEASLHLTNSLLWPRGADLLQWLAKGGSDAVEFDLDIPVYGSVADMHQYEHALRKTLRRLADTVELAPFLAAFRQERPAALPFNLGLSAQPDPDCWVQALQSPDMPLPAEGSASISFNGEQIALDPAERTVLAALLAHGARQVADLPRLSGLDMVTVRDTVSRLARRSLVLLAEG